MLRFAAVLLVMLCANAAAADPAALMAELRSNLELVRSSDVPSKSYPDPLPDVAGLVGLSRDSLRRGLGPPTACVLVEDTVSRETECSIANQWFYAFYRLPPNTFGGGLELIVIFVADGPSASVEWLHTQ